MLENCNFEYVGDTVDPEDGTVSQFEKDLPSPFQQVRARYLLALWLVVPFFGIAALWRIAGGTWPRYWFELALFWTYYGIVAAVSIPLVVGVWKLPVRVCIGRFPTPRQFAGGIKLTAFLYLVSLATLYAVFYPLSSVAPGFVEYWLIETPPLLHEDGVTYPVLANILSVLTLCVLAPVVEEAMFRGLLLPRFALKWGLRWGVVVSSAIFAVAHSDPVGAFIFAVAMCALYVRTQSLLLPMFCHGLNNLAAWVHESAYTLTSEPGHVYTLEEFRAGWTWAALAGAIAVVWAIFYLRKPGSDVRWELPVN